MRVIHFVPYYPPGRIGGVGAFAKALHEGLLRHGCESTVVTSGSGSSPGVERIARSRLGWFLGTLRFARRAARCDVVHCQSGEALPVVLALRLMPRRRARIVATFHSSALGILAAEGRYQLEGRRFGRPRRAGAVALAWLHHAVDALTLRLADGAVAVSRASALDCFGSRRGSALRVIHSGVEPAEDGPDARPIELLFVGVSRPCKRANALPLVLARVRRELPGVRLRIVGFRLEDAPELAALLEELELGDAVECVGPRSPEALRSDYRSARLLVLPSAYEGLPTVLLEAMHAALPVVATRVAGHPEAIDDGINGCLVAVDRPEEMAARCIEILRDPELRDRLGRAARETARQRFDLARQVDAYLDYYRALSKEMA